MKLLLVSALASLAVIASAALAAEHRDAAVHVGQQAPAEGQIQLIGMEVMDQAGRVIGDITNVLIDDHGRVHGVIVRHGAVLGVGGEETAIPFDQVRLPPPGPDVLEVRRRALLDLTEGELAELPVYEGYE
ncbi:MAG: PRC-barrel domain containing protein [Rhodospirillales bacterium]|nr:MAG: PRC-barrel domain containing protein [Rhodospirillales bacterium]